MADVVVWLCDTYVKAGVAWNAEFFACAGFHPVFTACQFVLAAASCAFHDFGSTRIEGKGSRQNHAH